MANPVTVSLRACSSTGAWDLHPGPEPLLPGDTGVRAQPFSGGAVGKSVGSGSCGFRPVSAPWQGPSPLLARTPDSPDGRLSAETALWRMHRDVISDLLCNRIDISQLVITKELTARRRLRGHVASRGAGREVRPAVRGGSGQK